MLHVSQKTMFKMSQLALAAVLPSGVSSFAPSQDHGSGGISEYASLVYCVYMFAGTGVGNLGHESLSRGSARMVSCVCLVTG